MYWVYPIQVNGLVTKLFGSKEHYDQRTFSTDIYVRLMSASVRKCPYYYIIFYVNLYVSVDRNVTLIYYSMYIYTCPLIVILLLYTILCIFIRVR